jgi:SAM-dependent methyltransferase
MGRISHLGIDIAVRCASLARRITGSEWAKHPIDIEYGIETSRKLSRFETRAGEPADKTSVGYAAVQPSILRRCLSMLPIDREFCFVDVGCGKGRALAVATEFPFSTIIGLELSPLLCRIAESNAAILAKRFQSKTKITIVQGDATAAVLPTSANIVFFLYNPFFRDVTRLFVERLQGIVAENNTKIFVIYVNPVHFDLLDKSRSFGRFYAKRLQFLADERLVAPFSNDFDSVIIFQSLNRAILEPLPGARATVNVTIPEFGADVCNVEQG